MRASAPFVVLFKSLQIMAHLAPLRLEDGSVIYIEIADDAILPSMPVAEPTRTAKGIEDKALQNFQALQETIRAYTSQTLEAFKGMTTVNIDKVKLEFGIKVAGEVNVPYITRGSSDCNLKITVECSFPD